MTLLTGLPFGGIAFEIPGIAATIAFDVARTREESLADSGGDAFFSTEDQQV